MRENPAAKAKRYLHEGRVVLTLVGPGRVEAVVRGDGVHHATAWRYGTWSCTCPARGTCCHLLAVRSVVAVDLLEVGR